MKKIVFLSLLLTVLSALPVWATSLKKGSLHTWDEEIFSKKPPFAYAIIFSRLREELKKRGIALDVSAKVPFKEADFIFIAWFEWPKEMNPNARKILWQLESPSRLELPPSAETKKTFEKIFTYRRDLADGKQIFALPIPYGYFAPLPPADDLMRDKKMLVAQVAGCYLAGPSDNIYLERFRAMYWFLKLHPDESAFAGRQCDKYSYLFTPAELTAVGSHLQGEIDDKQAFLKSAKFTLVFENARGQDYVTEKIFDAMMAGTVPVYLGAPNITDFVPQNCFIDFSKFNSYEELYAFLSTMNTADYRAYLENIRAFVTGKGPEIFSPESVWKTMKAALFTEE